MNAVEIEEAVSDLAHQPFDPAEFAFRFLAAFSARDTTLKRLRKGDSNQSDVPGGVLWRGNIHLAAAPAGEVGTTLAALRASPRTAAQKAKFILATDGETVEAEDLIGGDVVACAYAELPRHFATFLPLAGISTVKEIKNNPIDVKATGRLNKLYVELLKDNPDWATEERRHALNQFMARLIFCFFAEDTGIFRENQFTATITQMSHAGHGSGDEQWGNTHDVLTEMFRAMDTPVTHDGNLDPRHRIAAAIRPYADVFPYVNGGLFTGATDSPRFSRTARAYLLRAGELDWKEINPDIFGSMIQAVADDGERGELGMHYTSVPNILKVLNPLFLDDLRVSLEAAGDSRQRLRNLRKRLGSIRVFDPACGSGNFLVIAYKEMRAIEAAIVAKLGGEDRLKLAERRSVIPLSNFYGIEIKGFAAEIARLALLIAEFQADCLYLSQQEARAMVLPLHKTGQITVGNALRLDWLEVCPPHIVNMMDEQHLDGPTARLALDEAGLGPSVDVNTYICGNPPYLGSQWRSVQQQADMDLVFAKETKSYKDLDYVSAWYLKAARYCDANSAPFALVATKTICQGIQVAMLWPLIFKRGLHIAFAHRPFNWGNLAKANAGVTCVVVGVSRFPGAARKIFEGESVKLAANIGPYLIDMPNVIVSKEPAALNGLPTMDYGNKPSDGGHLIFETFDDLAKAKLDPVRDDFVRRYVGSFEFVRSTHRYCLWIPDSRVKELEALPHIRERIDAVRRVRTESKGKQSNDNAANPHRFVYTPHRDGLALIVPRVTSENRPFLPCGFVDGKTIIADTAAAVYDAPIWLLSVTASRLHQQWIATVCVRLRTDYRYSNTLGYNTFPVPRLTEQDKADLTRTAENILLAREAHFPATIADLYDPEAMPDDLRRAHEENDEMLERIYIGRRFRNDTERLEKLFDLYTKMTANSKDKANAKGKAKMRAATA